MNDFLCLQIVGLPLPKALASEVLHYSIQHSLFDTVVSSLFTVCVFNALSFVTHCLLLLHLLVVPPAAVRLEIRAIAARLRVVQEQEALVCCRKLCSDSPDVNARKSTLVKIR